MDWLSIVRARRDCRVMVADQIIGVIGLGTPSMLATFVTEDSERDRALGCCIHLKKLTAQSSAMSHLLFFSTGLLVDSAARSVLLKSP
jgi:hypothetical protein